MQPRGYRTEKWSVGTLSESFVYYCSLMDQMVPSCTKCVCPQLPILHPSHCLSEVLFVTRSDDKKKGYFASHFNEYSIVALLPHHACRRHT